MGESIPTTENNISPEQGLYNVAKELYKDLPYHNWDHALEVRDTALEIADRYLDAGIYIDRQAVDFGSILHDIHYDKYFNPKDYINLEEFQAAKSAEIIEHHGFSDDLIYEVREIVRGTAKNSTPSTLEGKIVRRADLSNVGGPYDRFVINAMKLLFEQKYLTGCTSTPSEWAELVCLNLHDFIDIDVSLTEIDEEQGLFRGLAFENILRLREESPGVLFDYSVLAKREIKSYPPKS